MEINSPEQLKNLLVKKYGRAKLAKGGWYRIPCPTCNSVDAKKMKRYVAPTGLYTQCFICESSLPISTLLDGNSVIIRAAPSANYIPEENPESRIWPCNKWNLINDLPPEHPAIQFLAKDHLFDYNRYADHGIVYCPLDGGKDICGGVINTAERIIFPIFFKNEFVGWQCRTVPGTFYGDKPKVIRYFHIFNKGQYLYNYDEAKKYDTVIVTEGVKKALKFPNGVATFGKGITERQVQLIQEWPNIIIMLDGEPEAQKVAQELTAAIRIQRNCINVDPKKFGFDSPDDKPTEFLMDVIEKTKCHQKT